MSPVEPLDAWKTLVSSVQERRGPVMILGAPDSGKTTLAKFMVRELSEKKEAVAYIDGDMGQSTLGPPTTLGMVMLDGPCDNMDGISPRHVYFVGSTSPRGHGLETVVGLKRLLERSRIDGEPIAVVDTTGYVAGGDALELKYQKMDLLNPRHIVAVQRERELEPILRTQQGRRHALIHRLSPSPRVQRRSPEDRRRYRWSRFCEYFTSLRLHRIELRETSLTGTHHVRIHNRPQEHLEGLLVGLNDQDNFLVSLGLVETLDQAGGFLSCLVPTDADLERTRSVRLGSIRINLSEETDGERPVGSDG